MVNYQVTDFWSVIVLFNEKILSTTDIVHKTIISIFGGDWNTPGFHQQQQKDFYVKRK